MVDKKQRKKTGNKRRGFEDWQGLTREAAKTETFRIFFSKNGYQSERKRIFETLFPTFSLFMKKAKSVKHQHFAEC